MAKPASSESKLRSEIAQLRAALAQASEAEDTLRAIRSGEIDALVLESAAGPRVFTLQGLDAESNRFRGEILAQVNDAVIVTDEMQRVTYLNAAAERQYGVTGSMVLGCRLNEVFESFWLQPGDEAVALAALQETGHWLGENIHVKNGCEAIYVESSVTQLRARDGSPAGLLAVIRDISERKRADQALRESEERYRQLFQSVQEGFYLAKAIFNESGKCCDATYVDINPAFQCMVGRPREQIIGKRIRDLLPDLPPACFELFGEVTLTGEPASRQVYVESLQRHFEAFVFRPAAGHFGVLATDITGAKQAEEKERRLLDELRLHQRELEDQNARLIAAHQQVDFMRAHYHDLFNLAPVGYIIVTQRGLLAEVNTTAAALLGGSRPLLVGKSLAQFVHEKDRNLYQLHQQHLAETGSPQVSELRLLKQDGTAFWARIESTTASDQAGRPVARVILTDITAHKQVEQALRHSEQYARSQWSEVEATLEAIPANIALLDADGRIMRINRAWAGFAAGNGIDPAAVGVGTDYLAVCDAAGGDDEATARAFGLAIREIIGGSREHFAMEYPCHSAEQQRWFMGYVTAAGGESATRAVIAHVDITQLKHIEEQMLILNRELEQRVRNRTHELQQTITALQTEFERRQQLEREILEISEREQCRLGQDLHDGVGQELAGTAMLGDVLGRQLDAQSNPLAATAYQLAAHIRSTIDSTRRLAKGLYPIELSRCGLLLALQELAEQTSQRSGCSCQLYQSGILPELSKSVEIHIYRIVQECLGNAVKHGKAQHITIESRHENGHHVFTVTDDGSGFDPSTAGAGMGLHLMDYRARIIGGTLEIERPATGGCRVTCRLNYRSAAMDAPAGASTTG